MALHIQMSEEALKALAGANLRRKLGSFFACSSLLLFSGCILYFTYDLIDNRMKPTLLAYTAQADNAPPSERPSVKELSSKSIPAAASVAPSVIVATTSSPVSLNPIELPPMEMSLGASLTPGLNMGADLGEGIGEQGGTGLGSSRAGGSTLEGTLYDLKLTKSGARNKINPTNNDQVLAILAEFFKRRWAPTTLSKYYQSATKLHSSYFLLPTCSADYAPHAFQCAKKTKPSALVIIYRGKVRAPKTGRFRFVGTGDDVIAVRFNRQLVLESGWSLPGIFKNPKFGHSGVTKHYKDAIKEGQVSQHKGYKLFPTDGIPHWNNVVGGLMGGNIFNVKEGEVYPIEILIAEIPGGMFGFCLLIEDLDEPIMENGKVLLDIFRTDFTEFSAEVTKKALLDAKLPANTLQVPKFNKASGVWPATL